MKETGRVGLRALVAATFFMVAGGPYGLEELVQKVGFAMALVVIAVTPLVWSLPTSLMVGELAAAVPHEGGYYAWVRRAMGPFWGYQEAWLSLAAGIFDIGIYPSLFAAYLARLVPACAEPSANLAVRAAVLAWAVAANLRGTKAVGVLSEWLGVLLVAPFGLLVALAWFHPAQTHPTASATHDVLGGVLVAMWNTMGWDNASTIASDVERPQRTYPTAMLATVAIVVMIYALPIAAAWRAGIDPDSFGEGGWADVAERVGGKWLGVSVVVGGMLSAVGMLGALVLSYSRLVHAVARDGLLPRALVRQDARGVPRVAIVVAGALFSLSLTLSFDRLVMLDILLYGASLVLEMVALVVLRVREPELARPFRVPLGVWGCVLVGAGPTLLLAVALAKNYDERIMGIRSLWLALAIALLGPLLYLVTPSARASARSRR